MRGFSGEMNFQDGCSWRVGIEIELQKLEKSFRVEHRDGKLKSASEERARLCRMEGDSVLPSFARLGRRGVCPYIVCGEHRRLCWRRFVLVFIFINGFGLGDVFYEVEAGVEFELQPKFLRGQGTSG